MAETTLDIIVQMNIQAAKAELTKLRNIVGSIGQKDLIKKTDAENFKELQKQMQLANSAKSQLGRGSNVFKEINEYVKKLITNLKLTKKQIKTVTHENKKFKFDFLTLLFVGMMLKKTFGGMFKSIIDNYKKITGLHSQFNKSLLKLQAGFGYLKFSIANALNSPGIIKAIEWFTDRIVKLGDYLVENPGIAITILGVIGALYTIGTLSSIASGIIQLGMLMEIMGASGAGAAITNLKALSSIAGIAIGFYLVFDGVKDVFKKGTSALSIKNIIKTSLGATLLSWGVLSKLTTETALTSGVGAATIGLAVFSIGISLALIFNGIEKAMDKEAGWRRVGALLLDSLGAMVAGGLAGAAIGSFFPVVGTGAGFLLGFIVTGLGVIFKLSSYKVEKSDIPAKDLIDNLTSINENISQPINTDNNFISSFSSDVNDFKENTDLAKESLTDFSDLAKNDLSSNISFVNVDMAELVNNQDDLNTYVTVANEILPTYTNLLDNNITKTLNQADATNKAAAAQERYNRALSNKKSSSNNNSFNLLKSSFSTSTQSSFFTNQ